MWYDYVVKSRQKKVLVAVPTNGTDGRLRIAGILKYARARASWDIHFVCSRTSFTDEEVHDVLKSGLDGCILAAYTPAVEDILARRIPTVIALEGISTADVVAHIHISRSLLDLRFRQLRNESVMDGILGIRLAAVRDRIEKTDRKFLTIGAECGFRNPDYLKRLFKSRFGMSMREYRAAWRKD